MSNWREKYLAHLASDRWATMKRNLIRLRGDRCQHCGRRVPLQLHHKNYVRLGAELPSDLELLCAGCHEKADRRRERESSVRAVAALYRAGR
jgi:5-methylcytosine-specific restriction endonuclease McrA